MIKKSLLVVVFFLILFSSPHKAMAQSADCSTFSVSPESVRIGDSFAVQKSDGLDAGQVVRATILNTTLSQQVRDCESNPAQCNEISGGIVELFDFDTSSLTEDSYTIEIFYFNGANTCTTTRSLSVTNSSQNFCSPLGIVSASPLLFSPNEDIGFTGCIGSNSCNGQAYIIVTDVARKLVVREIPITQSLGSCNSRGEFTKSFGGFDTGVYSAQLSIGTGTNASFAGNSFEFEVDSGADQQSEEGNPCTTIFSGLVCTGILQRDTDNQLRCAYEPSQCISCDECTQPLCSAAQVGMCRRSTQNTAGQVSEGCTQGLGYVNTAIGCIPFNLIENTTSFFLAWGLAIGGGVALLLIGISAILFATSSGIPDKISNAKSLFWAAIAGLGMLILSVFLLQVIGINVLGLFS